MWLARTGISSVNGFIRFIVLALIFVTQAEAAVLVPTGASWRWRPGTNEASTPIHLWRDLNFADTQFTTAPAPFWYGDPMTGGTVISGMQNNYLSVFLRKTFVVTNLAEIGGLRLGSIVDDGFVAWINTNEVLRVRVPGATGTPVTTNTLADNAVEPVSFTTNTLPLPVSSYLVVGTNILAVQLFQSSLGSTDLGFDCSLESILTETNPPTVLNVSPPPGTINSLNQITVTFSEPVTGVAAAHLLVNGIGASSITAIDEATYVFSFVQPPYGNVAITWSSSHNIHDQALPPNRFNATGPGATWSYTLVDNTPPSVAALTPGAGATVRSLNSITVLFTEGVLGVDAWDLLINNTGATNMTPTGANEYIFTFPEPPTGIVQVAWADGHDIIDQASPANAFAGGDWTYRLDPNATDAAPYISEFMASNTRTLADENGFFEDWIEIYNPSGLAVNLDGWHLTDSDGDLRKWTFPATNLPSGGFLVVFASGNDRRVPGMRLHTSFQLSAGGEYLALVNPDDEIVSEFDPSIGQVPDVSYGFAQSGSPPEYTISSNAVYFTTPTPGTVNLGGTAVPGPIIENVLHTPNVPLDHEDLVVTARVRPSARAVGSVTMRYRIMFSNEVTVTMFDDGAHGDGPAGNGVYGATIPANLSTNGQMIRYLISATDINGNASRWPLFTNPTNTAQYLGTIVDPTNVTSKLPIFHLFVSPTELPRIDTESGGRISFLYDGEFYDNIYMELRGNTSAGLAKKAHRIEFNRGHELRHAGPGGRTRKSSLLGEYLDPAYLRQHLCFWFLNSIGVPAPYDYPVRVQMNAQFYQLAFHNDVIGQEQVERLGYDPKGALYKAVGNLVPSFQSTGVFQKLEPDNDPSRTDYLQLANGINESSTVTVRRNTVFDLLDLPQVINHLSGARWCAENDDVWANMSIYRDTLGDGLWRCIPFDMNASWGQLYGGSSPLEATVDGSKSHPLYGGASTGGNYNRLYDVIVTLPETRQMLLRRERSIMDMMVQAPSTPAASLIIENYIKYMTNLISVEANMDRARWGFSPWASGKTFEAGVGDLLVQYVGPRRQHWYVTHCITNTSRAIGIANANNAGIPLTQPQNVSIQVVSVDFNPLSGNQQQEFICISNPVPFALDISGWQLDGAVDFTFKPGTVLPSNFVAFVSPNTREFRARTTGPRGGQGLFVLGPYNNQLSARGETIVVKNANGQTVSSYTYQGAPSLAQRFLRITEIMYHPTPGNPIAAEEYEYIELRNISTNIALNLAGVRFINGVDFTFTGGAVTTLAPGARVLVVKNSAAFSARYGSGLPVAGQFTGNLANDGERIQLVDSTNDEILDFDYEDDWYPITDGHGFSLVVVNENADPDAWDSKTNWRASGQLNGSPGTNEPVPPVIAPVVITEALSRTDNPPPTDSIELHNPTDQPANISRWWLTDDFNSPQKYRLTNGTVIPAGGYIVLNESHFNANPAGFALSSDGDEVWLFSADSAGNLTGYFHGHRFGAAENGVTFGRYITSVGEEHFVSQTAGSLGGPNAGPLVGPIVINEIMYRPPDNGTNDNSADEFIELLNIASVPVQLFDPSIRTNTWRLRGGVDFNFPTNITLAAGEFLLLVNFDPANAAALTAFRTRYGVSGSVKIFGPYDGKLNNSGENVEIRKPTTPLAGNLPYVVVDTVSYEDAAPWPAGADGYGLSLQRKVADAYGNDPINWAASPPTAAAHSSSGSGPTITGQPQSMNVVAGTNVILSVNATGPGPLRYQWRFNGANIANGTNSILQLPSIQGEQSGEYNVAVFNNAGSAVSSNAIVTVVLPATIIQHPAGASVNPGANVTFSVVAYSGSPLRYQWQKDGVNLPNATNTSLTVIGAQPDDSGEYVVVITDAVGSTRSDPAFLAVRVTPDFVVHPASQSIVPGSTVTFSWTVTNGASLPMGYRIRSNTVFLSTGYVPINSRVGFLTITNVRPPFTNFQVAVSNIVTTRLSSSAILTYLTDVDGDGIADEWESRYGVNDGSDDADLDTMSNWEEYIAGTDPTNSMSYLKVEQIASTPATATVEFIAVSNRTYTLEYTDALGDAWLRLADIAARTNSRVESVIDRNPTPNRFYRLATPRQP